MADIVYYCPVCWAENPEGQALCSKCHHPLTCDKQTYGEKLLRALDHPVRDIRSNAIAILGKIKDQNAVPFLISAFSRENNIYLQREIIKTISQIPSPAAFDFCLQRLEEDKYILRLEALSALATMPDRLNPDQLARLGDQVKTLPEEGAGSTFASKLRQLKQSLQRP